MVIRMLFFLLWISSTCFPNSGKWESTQFIWNFGIISSCDVGVPKRPRQYFTREPLLEHTHYRDIQSGDVVWIPPHLIFEFYEKVFPQIQVPFVLVISDGDASFPSDCLKLEDFEDMLSHKNIIHIFAQNCDYQGPSTKISPIPIGIDFHTVAYKGSAGGWGITGSPRQQEAFLLQSLTDALPTNRRKCRAFIDFHHSDTMHASFNRYLQFGEDRASIFKTILVSKIIDYEQRMPRDRLWKTKLNYAFSISPHGNGLDCHRTWDDLALGCIVIVKSSPLDPLYEGLPVVIIQNWDEINEENFQKWIVQYGDAFTNPVYREKLTHQYWMSKIINAAKPYKHHD